MLHTSALIAALLAAHLGAGRATSAAATGAATSAATSAALDVAGTVADSASAKPIANAQVSVTQSGRIVLNTTTDDFGRYRAHNLDAGRYTVSVHALGFRAQNRDVVLDDAAPLTTVDFRLATVVLNLAAIEVKASSPLAVNTRTGDQIFKQDDYHGAPTATTSQILQQTIAGAARAPTGEVHIRG
jgi:hypothetical protein